MNDPDFDVKFLYLTPERIAHSQAFLEALDAAYRNGLFLRIAIDEAHCISEWGHDFRPSYRQLSVFAKRYPGVPIVAVTGTLTPTVRTDILQQLGIADSALVLQASFNRTNLWLEVLPRSEEGMSEVLNYILNTELTEKTGIIYCMTCREAEELAEFLRSKELKAAYYHGSLSAGVRSKTQAEWMNGKVKVICTTIAFGLGIDKPDVRYVIHATMPASLEAYYQQVGRAGRDQQLSACAMFYNHKDIYRIKHLIKMGSEEAAQRRAMSAESNLSGDAATAVRLMRKKKRLKMALTDDDGNPILSEGEREAASLAKAEGRRSTDDNEITEEDVNQELHQFKEEKLDDVVKFCMEVNVCRRTQLLGYFGEAFSSSSCNDTCDVCYRKKLARESQSENTAEPKLKRLSRRYAMMDPLMQRTLPPAKYQELRLKSMSEGVRLPTISSAQLSVRGDELKRTSDELGVTTTSMMPPIVEVFHDAVSSAIPQLFPSTFSTTPVAELEARKTAALKELASDPHKRKEMTGQIRHLTNQLRKKLISEAKQAGAEAIGDFHQTPEEIGTAAEADEVNEAPEDDPDAGVIDQRRVKSEKQRERQLQKMQVSREQSAAVSSVAGSQSLRRLYEICSEEARERGLKERDILSHVSIKEICRVRPTTISELASIKGVGARKASAIADRVLILFQE